MKYLYLITLVVIFACSKKNDLELEIINQDLKSLNVEVNSYEKFLFSKPTNLDGKTILTYKLTNKSNKVYYFNIDALNPELENNFIKTNNIFVGIEDEKNSFSIVKRHDATMGIYPTLKSLSLEYLGYKNSFINNKNFVIYPNQTIYFEWFIFLPYGNIAESSTYTVEFNPQKKYFAEIFMNSDSTNYKKTISRVDLQTIKENGYEVYHGVIKSKNKIPIKFVNLPK